MLALEKMRKTVTAHNLDPVPEVYRFLPHADRITSGRPVAGNYDAYVVLDSDPQRAGLFDGTWPAHTLINIDHHMTNARAWQLTWLDADASATRGNDLQARTATRRSDRPRHGALPLYVYLHRYGVLPVYKHHTGKHADLGRPVGSRRRSLACDGKRLRIFRLSPHQTPRHSPFFPGAQRGRQDRLGRRDR